MKIERTLVKLFAVGICFSLLPSIAFGEMLDQRDAHMEWWREARFGMFIHWGVYAVPAGEWKGKPVKGSYEILETM